VEQKRARKRNGLRPSVQPRPAGQLLDTTFRWLKLDDKAQSFLAMRAFALAAGARIGEHARGERLRGSILYVRCDSAAWAQNLHLMKAQLLERLHKVVGGAGVNELRFNIGPLEDVAAWERPVPTVEVAPLPEPPPPPDVAQALADVDDEELREQLLRLYGKLGTRKR